MQIRQAPSLRAAESGEAIPEIALSEQKLEITSGSRPRMTMGNYFSYRP